MAEVSKKRFPDESRTQYTYPSAEELLDNLKDLTETVNDHMAVQRPRLDELDDYYEGDNVAILKQKRRKEEHLADHRATHNFAEYVSQFIQGYMSGIPIKVTHEDLKVNDMLDDFNAGTDGDAHNGDLILDLSIYGRAYELLYRNMEDVNKLALLSPLETFVIYDDTVEANPVAGVRYMTNRFKDDELSVHLYTSTERIVYIADDKGEYREEKRESHGFQGVPVIEYSNNRFRQGDYEKVLNLIDLYDAAQSDTANYMTDLNDAMLKIVGNLDIDTEKARDMKEKNLLFLQTEADANGNYGTADADYIYKKYDVAGVEKYKDRVSNDIHKFTNTPDMNDQSFAGTQSGESQKYKLFGLEQKRAIKESLFKRSMMSRYRLLNNILTPLGQGFDPDEIKITFTPNLPKALMEELKTFAAAGGELSQETLLTIFSLVENPQKEMERIEAETPKGSVYDFPKGDDRE